MAAPLDYDRWFPVVVAADRYCGLYSGGDWFAIAMADAPHEDFAIERSRIEFCLEDGPNGSDEEAQRFWRSPPQWIAVGDAPDLAVLALLRKQALLEADR